MAKRTIQDIDQAVQKLMEKESYAYCTGYLLSQLKGVIAALPEKQQQMAIASVVDTVNHTLSKHWEV